MTTQQFIPFRSARVASILTAATASDLYLSRRYGHEAATFTRAHLVTRSHQQAGSLRPAHTAKKRLLYHDFIIDVRAGHLDSLKDNETTASHRARP